MCGIAGIALNPDRTLPGLCEHLLVMREAMAHRGPDGAGFIGSLPTDMHLNMDYHVTVMENILVGVGLLPSTELSFHRVLAVCRREVSRHPNAIAQE